MGAIWENSCFMTQNACFARPALVVISEGASANNQLAINMVAVVHQSPTRVGDGKH
jgi:hypothetical protein